jgi:hypothetical protein
MKITASENPHNIFWQDPPFCTRDDFPKDKFIWPKILQNGKKSLREMWQTQKK